MERQGASCNAGKFKLREAKSSSCNAFLIMETLIGSSRSPYLFRPNIRYEQLEIYLRYEDEAYLAQSLRNYQF